MFSLFIKNKILKEIVLIMATESNRLNTRILLKYDTYANWTANNPVLLAGEVAIATIESGNLQTVNPNGVSTPQVLIKVGNGTSNYNDLKKYYSI